MYDELLALVSIEMQNVCMRVCIVRYKTTEICNLEMLLHVCVNIMYQARYSERKRKRIEHAARLRSGYREQQSILARWDI